MGLYFVITIPITVLNQLINKDYEVSVVMAVLTGIYYLYQITLALKLTCMVAKAKVVKWHSIPTYIIVWLVCISTLLSTTIKVLN